MSSSNSTLQIHDGDIGIMFYMVHPSVISSFKNVEDVPPFVQLAVPFFVLFILVEMIVSYLRGIEKTYEFKDTLTSFGSGAFQQVFGTFYKVLMIQPYIYVYNNHRFFTLDQGKTYSYICKHTYIHTYMHTIDVMWCDALFQADG